MSSAENFLREFHPGGSWTLTCIDPDSKAIDTRTFDDVERMRSWIERWNGTRNLYFSVNPTARPLTKKAARKDIKEVSYLHVDVDPRANEDLEEEQARIKALVTTDLPDGVPPPTYVVFSGGGYQAFWKLKVPIAVDGILEKAEDAKLYNLALERAFVADSCHNIDRIMRLPGTYNLPDARKLARGRTRVEAELIVSEPGFMYDLSCFEKAEGPITAQSNVALPADVHCQTNLTRIDQLNDLDKWGVPDRVKVIIADGRGGEPKPGDDSRSAWLYDVVCNMVRCGVPDDVLLGVITDPDWKISESVLDKGHQSIEYAIRNIGKAHEQVNAEFQPVNKNGVPAKNYRNVRLAVLKLGVTTRYDDFRKRLLVGGHELSDSPMPVSDRVLSHLRQIIVQHYGFDPGKDLLDDAVRQLCFENAFDPVLDYLDGLAWDGVKRVDRWLVDYFGAPDTDYIRVVGRILLIAAVRRARQPGCKFDTIVVLEGMQGTGKSSALLVLAGHPDFFSDQDILAVDTRQQAELMEGVWLYELAELEGLSRAEASKVKAFASRQVDRARAAYARHRDDNPRRCVFVGTCNESQYLKDRTGNRRFLPVETAEIDVDGLRHVRDQLWAEAALAEADGESIALPRQLWQVAGEVQDERVEVDPWSSKLAELNRTDPLSGTYPIGVVVHGGELRVTTNSVLQFLGVDIERQNAVNGRRLAPLMKKLGWTGPSTMRIAGEPDRGYRCSRTDDSSATPEDQVNANL
ncbi:MAG: VapE domain-containing protein [Pseudomonadota bacterium]